MGERKKNGQFAQGNSGKPKGAISERTRIWNEIGEWFKGEGLEAYQKNLTGMLQSGNPTKQLEGMKRFEALLEYFSPKLARTDSTVKHEGDVPITIKKTYKKGE
jgi:hypothetical protein